MHIYVCDIYIVCIHVSYTHHPRPMFFHFCEVPNPMLSISLVTVLNFIFKILWEGKAGPRPTPPFQVQACCFSKQLQRGIKTLEEMMDRKVRKPAKKEAQDEIKMNILCPFTQNFDADIAFLFLVTRKFRRGKRYSFIFLEGFIHRAAADSANRRDLSHLKKWFHPTKKIRPFFPERSCFVYVLDQDGAIIGMIWVVPPPSSLTVANEGL